VHRSTVTLTLLALAAGCSSPARYVRANADLGVIQAVAVLPFENVTNDRLAPERVHRIFLTELLAFDAFQVVEPGQVARTLRRDQLDPANLTPEELKRLGESLKAQAVFLGSILEYDEGRGTGSAPSPRVKLQLRLLDTETGTTLWSVVRSAGGAAITARLFGIGGEPASSVAGEIIRSELDRLLQ
jgi:TolB-like protein